MRPSPHRIEAIRLYRTTLQTARKFPHYNFRNYAITRAKEGFRENQFLSDTERIKTALDLGRKQLEVMRRQVTVGKLYQGQKLVIEYKEELLRDKRRQELGHIE